MFLTHHNVFGHFCWYSVVGKFTRESAMPSRGSSLVAGIFALMPLSVEFPDKTVAELRKIEEVEAQIHLSNEDLFEEGSAKEVKDEVTKRYK